MSKRYFDNSSKLKPGVVSDELRRALDIHRDKLPIWIYRMRVLGYPPGWLQQAKVSTLAIFDGSTEDGELNESSEARVEEYNKEALIEYPGFNTPVPEGVRDDWYMLGMPPMMPTQQLNEALKTMKVSEPVPYKRSRMSDIGSGSPSTSSASTSTPNRSAKSPNHSYNSDQTSLNESDFTPIKTNNSTIDSENDISIVSTERLSTNSGIQSPSNPCDISLNDTTESERKLKLISMGTPWPASERPKRPPLEKWGEGMGELLYFENPNTEYTGVYQNKMKGLIDKIRQKHTQT